MINRLFDSLISPATLSVVSVDDRTSDSKTRSNTVGAAWLLIIAVMLAMLVATPVQAQRGGRGGRGGPPPPAQVAAPIDITGYWVSVVTEDWKFRMVTPNPGAYDALTLNGEGRQVGDTWDPAADEAAGEACKGYGAPAIMRLAGRFHLTWEDDNTLRVDTDYGTQTRMFRFGPEAAGDPSLQGHSMAEWQGAPDGGGGLKVVTDNLTEGYIRKNGAPYSEQTTITEHYDLHTMPNGDQWLSVTTQVDDPVYFSRPLITSTDFKRLPDDQGWDPSPCSAR
jgi:hypothetical protein